MTWPQNPYSPPPPGDDDRPPSTAGRVGTVVAIVAMTAVVGIWIAAILLAPIALVLLPWLLVSSAGPE